MIAIELNICKITPQWILLMPINRLSLIINGQLTGDEIFVGARTALVFNDILLDFVLYVEVCVMCVVNACSMVSRSIHIQ